MCRLALFNRASVETIQIGHGDAETALALLFAQLDKSMGGHGIGVAALWQARNRIATRKSVKLSPELAAKQIMRYHKQGADWFLFHTRYASAGSVCDGNCHPFQTQHYLLAMNGHDNEYAMLGRRCVPELTDTETIAKIAEALDYYPSDLSYFSGVFIGWHKRQFAKPAWFPFVTKGAYGSLGAAQSADGSLFFASEMPDWFSKVFENAVGRLDKLDWSAHQEIDISKHVYIAPTVKQPTKPASISASIAVQTTSNWTQATPALAPVSKGAKEAFTAFFPDATPDYISWQARKDTGKLPAYEETEQEPTDMTPSELQQAIADLQAQEEREERDPLYEQRYCATCKDNTAHNASMGYCLDCKYGPIPGDSKQEARPAKREIAWRYCPVCKCSTGQELRKKPEGTRQAYEFVCLECEMQNEQEPVTDN